MKQIDIQTPDANLVAVCRANDSVQADLVKNMLIEHGIRASTSGENQSGFAGAFPVRVFVCETDVDNATTFIKRHFPEL